MIPLPVRHSFAALLGDGRGNVQDSDDPIRVIVRDFETRLQQTAINFRVPSIHDLPVIVGYGADLPDELQVLSVQRWFESIRAYRDWWQCDYCGNFNHHDTLSCIGCGASPN